MRAIESWRVKLFLSAHEELQSSYAVRLMQDPHMTWLVALRRVLSSYALDRQIELMLKLHCLRHAREAQACSMGISTSDTYELGGVLDAVVNAYHERRSVLREGLSASVVRMYMAKVKDECRRLFSANGISIESTPRDVWRITEHVGALYVRTQFDWSASPGSRGPLFRQSTAPIVVGETARMNDIAGYFSVLGLCAGTTIDDIEIGRENAAASWIVHISRRFITLVERAQKLGASAAT